MLHNTPPTRETGFKEAPSVPNCCSCCSSAASRLLLAFTLGIFRVLLRLAVYEPVGLLVCLILLALLVFDTILLLAIRFILLAILLLLLLSVLNLVFDQVVKRGDGSDKRRKVDGHELIIGLDRHGPCELAVLSVFSSVDSRFTGNGC